MQRPMMRAKIHRATVTDANLDYVGSISIDEALMLAADLREFEQVHVLDITNGARLVTYAMRGEPGSICLNGAAAHLVDIGDLVIIVAYADVSEEELATFEPRIVHVDAMNRIDDPVGVRDRASLRSQGLGLVRGRGRATGVE